ncbi:MAG: glycosyltransferase [Elusimicrobia bacterium]|nr:glycosyltransferase [Elusimicrobiota bacterium]
MSGLPGLSVVLPTLDEAGGLKVLLPRLRDVFKTLNVEGEILVVDGGSKDDTVAVAQSHGARVQRQQGRGFGSALREGLRDARSEWVAVMDADVSHAPEDLVRFWARRGDAELIVGSRYCRGGSAEMPLTRQVLSRALNQVSRRVLDLPVRESSSGFRLYRGLSVRAVTSDATDFSVQQDLLVGILAGGGRVIELPIHYAPRVGGASKANAWKLAPAYVRLLLRLKPLRGGWAAEWGVAAVLILGALAARSSGPVAMASLALGAFFAGETVRLRLGKLPALLAACAWIGAGRAGAPLLVPAAAVFAAGLWGAAAALDSAFPPKG